MNITLFLVLCLAAFISADGWLCKSLSPCFFFFCSELRFFVLLTCFHFHLKISFLLFIFCFEDFFLLHVGMQYRHTKDTSLYAQTCAVYGGPQQITYWSLVGTWSVYTTCRECGSPFHNFSRSERDRALLIDEKKSMSRDNDNSMNNNNNHLEEFDNHHNDAVALHSVHQEIDIVVEKNEKKQKEKEKDKLVNSKANSKNDFPPTDPNQLNPCCIYGNAPYFAGPDFLASALNPSLGGNREREEGLEN